MGPDLTPYVPRLVLSWAQETPDARYRRIAGSLAFCDVSGFTAMSERLSRQGRVGAEELTDILNAVFAELLEQAATYGGSMLKYGGDAVLVFFWGDGHERRAAAATAAMRASLRVVGKRQTSAGRVSLRMSVGVHSGAFDFFLVGDSHRELVVAGPAATLTCEMEATADAGQILLSPATAAALAPSQLGAAKGGGVLLARAPAAPRTTDLLFSPAGVDPAAFVPVALRRHLEAGGQAPEHRQVVIGFLGFSGIDKLLDATGGVDVAGELEALLAVVNDRFNDHGVTFLASDIYGDGGKVIAVAGAPTGWDNNDERMLRAMREVLDAYDGPLPLHVGLNRGAVFTGDVGPRFRRTYTMLGDAVNTAARVMAKAGHNEIRTMPAVLDRSATLFDVVEQEPFAAKGKKEPLLTFSVGHVVGRRPDVGERIPLIGREAELSVLLEAADRAGAGDGSIIELVGDAGIGKTRLVEELAATVRAPVLLARCEPYEISTPFFAARQLLSGALGGVTNGADLEAACARVVPQLRPWLPLLAAVLGFTVPTTQAVDQLDPSAYRTRLHAVLNDVFVSTVGSSAVFIVDDTQWLDAASTMYLDALATMTTRQPWLLLLSRRPQDDPAIERDETVKVITVMPLTAEAGAELAGVVAPRVLLPAQAARLAQRSGGHPLFVQELARAAVATGDLDALPDTVDAMIAARIDQLAPAARDRLRSASVLGASFDIATLREMVGESNLDDLVEFIDVVDGQARFRQALYQQAAYDGLPFRRRRVLHGAVARLLEAQGPEPNAGQLSLHFFQAQDYEPAWTYALSAGKSAEERFAFTDAAAMYKRAVAAARHVDGVPDIEVATAWKDYGRLLFFCGQLREATDAYRRARALARDDADLQAVLCLNEAEVRMTMGEAPQALRRLRRGIRLVETHPPRDARLPCRLLLMMAGLCLRRGDPAASMWARRAAETAATTGLQLELAHAYATLGAVAMQLGVGDAAAMSTQALELYAELGHRGGEGQMLNNLGYAAYLARDWTAAVDFYARGAAAHAAAGLDLFAATTRNNQGELLADQGRLDEAAAAYNDALATLETGGGYEVLYVFRNLAVVRGWQGDVAAAHELLDRAANGFDAVGATGECADTETRRALLYLLERRPADADHALDRAEAAAPDAFAPRIARLRGCARAQHGDGGGANAQFTRAVELAVAEGDLYEQALAEDALHRLTGGHSSPAAFDALGVVAPLRVPLS